MRILVVEDDLPVAAHIQRGLEEEGYAVDVVHHGSDASVQAQCVPYDAAVLDLLLPGRSGLQVLRDLRAAKNDLPVLVVSARDGIDERIAGLDAGADDYMVKPFAVTEVCARVRALLRRGTPHQPRLAVGDLDLDVARRTVTRAGRTIDLRPKEYAVLEFLMRHSDRPVTRSMIIEHVWDLNFETVSNIVDVHINTLRQKLDRGFGVGLIHTIRGVGYMLTDKLP